MLDGARRAQTEILTKHTDGERNEVASTQLEDVVDMASETKPEEYHKYDGSCDGWSVVIEDEVDLSIIRVRHLEKVVCWMQSLTSGPGRSEDQTVRG